MTLEQITRKDGENGIRVPTPAGFVDDAETIAVSVPCEAQIRTRLHDLILQLGHGLRILRIGQVGRESPVQLQVDARDVASDPIQRGRAAERGDTIARIDDDL